MYLSEISQLVQQLEDVDSKGFSKKESIISGEAESNKLQEQFEYYKKVERITKKPVLAPSPDEALERLAIQRKELKDLAQKRSKLAADIAVGISEIALDISPEPQMQDGTAAFQLQEKNPLPALDYLRKFLGVKGRLEIDDAIIEGDRVTVLGAKDRIEAVDKLALVVASVSSFGKVALGHVPDEVMQSASSVSSSRSFPAWQALVKRRSLTIWEAYSILRAKTPQEKKKVRDFMNGIRGRGLARAKDGSLLITLMGRLTENYLQLNNGSEFPGEPQLETMEEIEANGGEKAPFASDSVHSTKIKRARPAGNHKSSPSNHKSIRSKHKSSSKPKLSPSKAKLSPSKPKA